MKQRWPESFFLIPLVFQNVSLDLESSHIWQSDSCSYSGYHRSNQNLPMFLLNKWQRKPLLLPKLKSNSGSVFSQILTPDPKEKRRILPESTPIIRIRSHLRFEQLSSSSGWRFMAKNVPAKFEFLYNFRFSFGTAGRLLYWSEFLKSVETVYYVCLNVESSLWVMGSDSVTRVNDLTRVTIFGDSD